MAELEFQQRREALLKWMKADSIAILFAAHQQVRSNDVHYPFRQSNHFFYLSGFVETPAVAVLLPGRPEGEFVLFLQDKNPQQEIWEGRMLGVEAAQDHLAVDQAYSITEIDERLPQLMENKRSLYALLGEEQEHDQKIMTWLKKAQHKQRSGVTVPEEIILLQRQLGEMRLLKSAYEIERIRHACQSSALAHKAAMCAVRPGWTETQLEAVYQAEFLKQNCPSVGYPSIIAGGSNACILHYTEKSASLQADDLVLVDAGAEFEYYTADVSRTFPVSGQFSTEQKQLYQLVLDAQQAALQVIKPGVAWTAMQQAIVKVLTAGLLRLGILVGELETLIEEKAYQPFYMHSSGHWLGLDVHDVSSYRTEQGDWRPLQAGMVLTVEPGLYIHPQESSVDKKWLGIGIRIEDDVLVTEHGYEILTKDCPKSIAEIENLMAGVVDE